MNILHVCTSDIGGGAEKEARILFMTCRQRGHASWLAVGYKRSNDPDVLEIPRPRQVQSWARPFWVLHGRLQPLEGRLRGVGRMRSWLRTLAQGRSGIEQELGREDFDFPGSRRLLSLPPKRPDIIHAHNLHGGYFDLRTLVEFSHDVPVIVTLHDEWMMTGHCAYTLGCSRWESGCGNCPDLTIYPAIRRDATAYNWRRKQNIYSRSRLWVSTPSRWLMDRVQRSMLVPVEGRVINNGVDMGTFHPADRLTARAGLDLPPEACIVLFSANGGKRNRFKDYGLIERAIALMNQDELKTPPTLLIVLGGDGDDEHIGRVSIRHVPFQNDQATVARFYQAADVYVHAAKADNFPLTILEALACGKPVVATAVGGIPEQVKGLRMANCDVRIGGLNVYGRDAATGFLVPPGDAEGMALCIERLLGDEGLRRQLGHNAAQDARQRFDLQRQVNDYLKWYEEIIAQWKPW